MKKIFLLLLGLVFGVVLFFNVSKSHADVTAPDWYLDKVYKDLEENAIPFYTSMRDCKKFDKKVVIDNKVHHYIVYGVENNTCHVNYNDKLYSTCYFPLEVNKKIAEFDLKNLKDTLYNIKYKRILTTETSSDGKFDIPADQLFIMGALMQYCKPLYK